MADTNQIVSDVQDDYQKLAIDTVIVSERLCASLVIPSGSRVLDIACGTGHTAIAAARRRAVVTGIDINERSLARARLRAEAEGLDSIEFMKADAAAMPFPDASFDYALSTLGLVFLPDQETAARELARVVKPNGVIALTAYTAQSFPSQIYDMINSIIKPPAAPKRPHYTWSGGARIGELLGPYFHTIRMRVESFDSCFPSAVASFEHLTRWNLPIRMALQQSTLESRQLIRDNYLGILERFNRAADGTLIMDVEVAVITAVRSGH